MNCEPIIVVTGASGFLGRAVTAALRGRGVYVLAVSRKPTVGGLQVNDYEESPGGDILIHLAEDNNIARVNQAGTDYQESSLKILDRLLAKNYSRVVYASSALLYGDGSEVTHRVCDELRVNNTYLKIKSIAEQKVLASGKNVIVRLANLYGPGMSLDNVLSTIIEQLGEPGPIRVRDDKPIRDFLWVEDAVEAIVELALGAQTGIFNIGSGIGVSVRELAKMMMVINGEEGREILPYSQSEKKSSLVLDIDATSRSLGWAPKTSIKSGLEQMLKLEKLNE